MTLETGSILNNRYRIIEILGQGGMAAVYRAIDENLGVEVCVKENLFTTEEYARQFRLEATILAGLRQPNLPRVSDHFVIEPQGQYLVMDYIEGEDLRQRVDRLGALPEQEVIIIGAAICDALAYMHSRKPMILHRDIKPGNVRITPNGHIYLVDFGLVKLVEGRETTNTGARAMTPGYSPPEQYGTARTDPRSDIYSLGATLYSALTNVLPEDALDRAMNRSGLTPVLKHNPKISESVANIIEKCLAVRAEDRYQSAEDLRYALMEARSVSKRKLPLELVLQSPPPTIHERLPASSSENEFKREAPIGLNKPGNPVKSTRPLNEFNQDIELLPPRKKINRNAIFLMLLLPIIVISGLGIYSSNPKLQKQISGLIFSSVIPTQAVPSIFPSATHKPILIIATKTQTQVETTVATLTRTPEPTSTSTITPTPTITLTPEPTSLGGAEQIAFASNRSGVMEIWLMDIDGTHLVQVTNIPEGACQPKWSPDGLRIVFISPCTRQLTSYQGASLFIINADGTGLIPLPSVPGGDYDPSWSPDGNTIAFTSLRNGGVPGIFLINVKNYRIKSLVENESRAISQPAWSPDGGLIAYVNSDNRIWVMDINGENRRSLTIGGDDLIVVNGPAWSPDGQAVIYTQTLYSDQSGSTILMAVPIKEGGTMPVEVPNSRLIIDVSYSFDGYWLLFTSWFSGNHEISIMRPNGVDRHIIQPDLAYDFDPAWRPIQSNQP